MKRRAAIFFISLLVIAGLIALGVFAIDRREALVDDGQAQLSGVKQPVQIYFDKYSVPYIQARSEEDLIFAQGFATASERLFQMDILRRLANGEMFEVFGSHCLTTDRLARIVGFKRLAQAEYNRLALPAQKWLQCYCRGVNDYSARGKAKIPLEFILLGYRPRAWKPEDTLAILKYLQYSSDECWQVDVLYSMVKARAGAELAQQMFGQWANSRKIVTGESTITDEKQLLSLNMFPGAEALSWGSNGWVISKKLSQSGGALLVCDKDALFAFPDLFFSCSLRCPFVHVAGLTIPGVPGILIGRNDHIAWAPIAIKGRWQDLISEKFSNRDPDRYLSSQEWLKVKEFQEEIKQRFSNNVIEKVQVTDDGPILVKDEHGAVALSWYGCNPANNVIESIWEVNKAKNLPEFLRALKKYKGSPQAFLYADGAGNIAQPIAGYGAMQLSAIAHQPAADASTGEGADTNRSAGDADAADYRQQGEFIVANAVPLTESARLSSLGVLSNNWAALRANNVLHSRSRAGQTLGSEDMIVLQSDVKAPLSEIVTRSLRHALENIESIDQYQQTAFNALANWNGQLEENSYCASIYESFLIELTGQVLKEKIGLPLTIDYINKWPRWSEFTRRLLEEQRVQLLPAAHHGFSFFICNCFTQSLKNLRLTFNLRQLPGELARCQWKNLHQLDCRANMAKFIPPAILAIISPLLPPPVELGGDQDCINSCNYSLANRSFHYACNSCPGARLIIDMGDNDKFYQALTLGECAHLFSGDRIKQSDKEMNLWRQMKFHAIAFSDKELEILASHRLSLINENE